MRRTAALALLLVIAGCRRTQVGAPQPPRAVRVVAVRSDTLGATPYAGALEPRVKLDLAFGLGGRVRSVGEKSDGALLHEGDVVTKDQILARLDDADLRRQSAAASFAASSAAAEVMAAQTAVGQADSDLARLTKLAASGSIPQTELEKAQTASLSAHARLDTLRAQSGAKLEQLAIARRLEGDASLKSPIAGVIARRMIDPGENVAPATIAFTVIDPSEMKLVFAVPDGRVGALKLGELVPVHTDALPGTPFIGKISTIHPVADPALRTFTVELSIANGDGKLRAGMVASAAIPGTDKPQAKTLVPLASVVRAPNGVLAVFVAIDGKVSLRTVTLGDLLGNEVDVRTGLRDGEQVVTDGAPFLHEGEAVEVLP